MRKIKRYRKRKGTKKMQDRLQAILKFEDEFSTFFYNSKNKNKN